MMASCPELVRVGGSGRQGLSKRIIPASVRRRTRPATTVAYFTEGKPMRGTDEFEQVWEDARWQFANSTNRELFKANPERYAPQFGGYCAGGLAVGEYADGDPKLFTITDGKLYLIKNKGYQTVWRQGPEAAIHFGEYNWANRGELRDNMEFVQH